MLWYVAATSRHPTVKFSLVKLFEATKHPQFLPRSIAKLQEGCGMSVNPNAPGRHLGYSCPKG